MKNVVIIGAGPAGLTAASELLKTPGEYGVIVLEESDQIGGISRTVCHNGNRMDIGGHRFFSKDARVNAWWADIFPMQGMPAMDDKATGRDVPLTSGGPDPEREDEVMLSRRRVSRIYYGHRFFDYPIRMNLATLRNMGIVTTLKAGVSYLLSCAHKLPETSLENFYINRFGRRLYAMFFRGYTQKLWGRKPSEISADWGAQRVKGLSIRVLLMDMARKLMPWARKNQEVETSLIESFAYPKFGPGQLWEAVAQRILDLGGEIRMGWHAETMQTSGHVITNVICAHDGVHDAVSADIVISSMPIRDLMAGIPDTPAFAQEIAQGLPYRDFVTVGLLVDKLCICNETKLKTLGNIVPDCWIYVQDEGVHLGRIQVFNNWSPYMVRDPERTVFLGLEYFCAEGDDMWRMSDEQWITTARRELEETGVLDAHSTVLDAHVERVKKAYPAYFDTYARMDELRAYLDGFTNLYCIGRNGQHRYNNMDHSMATAFEAVRDIKEGITDRSNVWNVNTEKVYHEE